ncbi:MAG: class I SAM-dependent methyltransferase [Boseongicola sp.]
MTRREEVRLKFLRKMPRNSVAAEIGVWNGGFSRVILDTTEPVELHLIDPWIYQPEFRNTMFGRPRNATRMDPMYESVRQEFSGDDRVTLHRKKSEEALATFPDNYFDWVYIDGNHNEPFVTADLESCFKKVKPGGIISGDDYLWRHKDELPVRSAVTKFLQSFGTDLDFRTYGQQYLIRLPSPKPQKSAMVA